MQLIKQVKNIRINKISDTNFEVIVLRYSTEDKTIKYPTGDVFIPKGSEQKPSVKEWGLFGFTHMSLESAENQMHKLLKASK